MKTNFHEVTDGIAQVIHEWEPLLISLDTTLLMTKKNKQNRTIKQIVGHLIDSTSNNHQRIVRLQYNKHLVFPDYQQDNDLWLALQDYQHADWNTIVQLWKFYNLHMIQVIQTVDVTQLENTWTSFKGEEVTLKEMIEGYLSHLYLHMNEIKELIGK